MIALEPPETAAEWFLVVTFLVVVAFIAWAKAMSRWDDHLDRVERERMEDAREAKHMRQAPVLGDPTNRPRRPVT